MGSSNWTEEDVRRHQARLAGAQAQSSEPKASKYHNVKFVVDGFRFDSKREATVYQQLKLRQHVGEIRGLQCQVRFGLYAPDLADEDFEEIKSMRVLVSEYIADFVFIEVATERRVVIDAKGLRTQVYRLKKKWLELQEGIVIEEV